MEKLPPLHIEGIKMIKETEIAEKLAGSLTAETTDLLPYLPYLLQDFWELGSEPNLMTDLIKKHVDLSENTRILDLACGKGAVSIKIAQKLQVKIKGIDLIPEFIDFSKEKAKELNIGHLCSFIVGDINEAVKNERDYDIVILGGVGDVLGSPADTLNKLKSTIKTGGYILIDECFLKENSRQEDIQYNNYEYLTEKQWWALFKEAGLELIETAIPAEDDIPENLDSITGMEFITKRANELIAKYPHKKDIFEGYIRSQQAEYDDIDNNLIGVIWILKKL